MPDTALRAVCDPNDRVERGEHKHLCECGACWKHADDCGDSSREFKLAHKCPNCGADVRLKHYAEGDDCGRAAALMELFREWKGTKEMLNFKVNAYERRAIEKIAHRAMGLQIAADRPVRLRRKQVDFEMDISAVHASGCSLDLERLLAADDFNFAHDVFGIERHLDRETGQLLDCFLPRFTYKAQETVPGDSLPMRRTVAAKRAARGG